MRRSIQSYSASHFSVLLSWLLLPLLLLGSVKAAFAVTEADFRDAILGKRIFSDQELNLLDLNSDGKVDVSDVVVFLKSEGQPLVNFLSSSSDAGEGDGQALIKVRFSHSFTGVLKYQLTDVIAGSAPQQFTLNVDGVSADIPFSIIDDATASGKSAVYEFSLIGVGGYNNYVPGANVIHSLFVHENDTRWYGSLYKSAEVANSGGALSLSFLLDILLKNGVASTSLIADGRGFLPKSASGSNISAIGSTFSADQFSATFNDMPIPVGNSLLTAALSRTLSFQADNALAGQQVSGDLISGVATETISSVDAPYLNRVMSWNFRLLKAIPNIQMPAIQLDPVLP